jgi:hypothetical protein
MNKVEEYLVYANQCRLMAEWADKADDQVDWRNLAKLWYQRATEEAESAKVNWTRLLID